MRLLTQASFPVRVGNGERMATFELSNQGPLLRQYQNEPYKVIRLLVRRIDWRSRRQYKLRWRNDWERLCIGDRGRNELQWICPEADAWVKRELMQRTRCTHADETSGRRR